ncbi:MAG: hypothetical protein OEZ65_11460 [Gemmatimonadota bacterium]|nr:hypothetical protein [Gemmatimonadota bacterium]MDH5760197.1 hypothetical protein [Gemmatimonadota bacterium]
MRIVAVLSTAFLMASGAGAQETEGLFEAMAARSVGPAGMSGRVTAVDVSLQDRNIVFVGGATGGLFRSTDGGITWDPVFDDQPAAGIGAVAIFQPNPDIVWAGTGEGNPRNSAGVGRGLFRSLDGGDTWTAMGLEGSERIHRIVTHPTDPDVVHVGVMGPAWSDGEERGVYRTRDGGANWERVLWRNERTGVADLVMDPTNPDKLFAALWEFRREPWFFTSGGPGSGLFVTYDGGDTWTELTEEDGLPAGDLGRIGLAVARNDPDVVYALVEATRSALLRSDDGGRSFRTLSDAPGVAPRPFYYADLRVDPNNENRLYSLHSSLQVSEDQGRSWRTVVSSGIIHGDVHELWIDPEDSRRMIIGNDGGIAFTHDRGEHWRFVENLTLAQFYHVTVDNAVPFNVYGGLQDNGSWYGPSTVWESKGILNAHWRRVGGGDGFSVMSDFSDSRYGYSMSQEGNLQRFDRVTGYRRSIQPVHPEGTRLRFNWNAGLTFDPHDSTTIYLGSQFLHRSRDHGESWEIISPDLTTNDPAKQMQDRSGGLTLDATGAENHTTIVTIAPSLLEGGLIWVGTDDGKVQVTRDGGATWTDVTGMIRGIPAGTWVPDIEPSRHDPGTAYAVFEDHRRGNWEAYVYRTRDYGATWSRLPTAGVDAFAHVLAEDPVEPNLLFLGTEFGAYFSTDAGNSWTRWTSGVPAVPVRDALVHPRDGDLVLATHGRGILIVDDVRPLRALAAGEVGLTDAGPQLFSPPPALDVEIDEGLGYRSTGHAMQQGATRPFGAMITFWHHEAGRVEMAVRDAAGTVVYTTTVEARRGMNRLQWNLRPGGSADPVEFPSYLPVLPGEYSVSASAGEVTTEVTLRVAPDPRDVRTTAELNARSRGVRRAARAGQAVTEAQRALRAAMSGVASVVEALPTGPATAALRSEAREVQDALALASREFFTGPECQGICGGDIPAREVVSMGRFLADLRGAPSATDLMRLTRAEATADRIVDHVNGLIEGPLAALDASLKAGGFTPLDRIRPVRRGSGHD